MKVLSQNRKKILSITDSTNVSIGEESETHWNIFLNYNSFYNLGCYEGEDHTKQILTDIFNAIKDDQLTFEMPVK
jgi:hypothetical protein